MFLHCPEHRLRHTTHEIPEYLDEVGRLVDLMQQQEALIIPSEDAT